MAETKHDSDELSGAAGATAAPLEHDHSTFRQFAPMRLNLLTRTLTPTQGTSVPVDDASEISESAIGRTHDLPPLDALKTLTKAARSQRREVESKLRAARAKLESLLARQRRHNRPLVRLFSTLPLGLERQISRVEAEVVALETWKEASCIHITFEPAEIVDTAYGEMMRAFDGLRKSWAKWDVSGQNSVSGVLGRSSGGSEHPRASLEFRNGNALAFAGKALRFEAADKSAVLIYPAMVMTIDADSVRDLFDLRDLRVDATLIHVAEDGVVPPDTQLLRNLPSETLIRRADASLHHDHRLPICIYGRLTLRGPGRILGEYQFSNARAVEMFAEAFARFRREVYGDGDLSD